MACRCFANFASMGATRKHMQAKRASSLHKSCIHVVFSRRMTRPCVMMVKQRTTTHPHKNTRVFPSSQKRSKAITIPTPASSMCVCSRVACMHMPSSYMKTHPHPSPPSRTVLPGCNTQIHACMLFRAARASGPQQHSGSSKNPLDHPTRIYVTSKHYAILYCFASYSILQNDSSNIRVDE